METPHGNVQPVPTDEKVEWHREAVSVDIAEKT
jgi:hypothetical protein